MDSYWSRFAVETSPGLTLALVALVAAHPPYSLLRQRGRGRARSAVAYLSGLAAGFGSTVLLALIMRRLADPAAIVASGLLAAFFGPFVGMVRAKWERPRRAPRNPVMVRNLSS